VIKSFFIHAGFVVIGVLLAFGLVEVSFRTYQSFYNSPKVVSDLQVALQESTETTLDQIGDTDSLRGLIHPSKFTDIVYELKPNMRGVFLEKSLSTNQFGMRGRDTTLRKPAGVIRIAGLGDSVMFGWGVEHENAYLSVVEDRLRNSGHDVEVLNFAVPGYNTAMEVATFHHRAMAFDPDIVVIHFVSNDLDVPHFMYRAKANQDSLAGSRLLGAISKHFKSDKVEDVAFLDVASVRWDHERLGDVLEEYRHMAGRRAFMQAMRQLARSCKEKDIPLIMLLGSHTKLTREAISNRMAPRMGFRVIEASDLVDSYFKEQHPGANKLERGEMLWVSDKDSHPNKLGHSLYADALTPVLDRIILENFEEPFSRS